MTALFRLQRALALPRPEATALGVLLLLLALGTAGRVWQAGGHAFDPALYAAPDAALAAAARAETPLVASALGVEPTPETAAGEVAQAAAAVSPVPRRKAAAAPQPTNVNTASVAELDRLPGIGPALASRIVAHREAHGPFAAPAHLQRVKGIGARTFEKMAPYVLVE